MIGELARDHRVIALAFHVDYWNHLGWRDPFSSPQWSARQEAYARTMRLAGPYTPQMVVDGEMEMVGSDRDAVNRAIARASRERAEATITLRNGVARGSSSRPLDLFAAIVQNAAPTPVRAGENSGRTLRNDAIVRELKRIGRVNGTFALPVGKANVVFLQDPATLRIFAASTAS